MTALDALNAFYRQLREKFNDRRYDAGVRETYQECLGEVRQIARLLEDSVLADTGHLRMLLHRARRVERGGAGVARDERDAVLRELRQVLEAWLGEPPVSIQRKDRR